MPVAAPKWLQNRFGQIWEEYGERPFSLAEATTLLGESKEVVTVILSRLRKSGWVRTAFNESDYRKRTYVCNNPANIFKHLEKEATPNASHTEN